MEEGRERLLIKSLGLTVTAFKSGIGLSTQLCERRVWVRDRLISNGRVMEPLLSKSRRRRDSEHAQSERDWNASRRLPSYPSFPVVRHSRVVYPLMNLTLEWARFGRERTVRIDVSRSHFYETTVFTVRKGLIGAYNFLSNPAAIQFYVI